MTTGSQELVIRPLQIGEEPHWLSCAPPPKDLDAERSALRASLAAATEDPACRLLAWEEGRCVGRLRLQLPHSGLCLLLGLAVPQASQRERVGRALIRYTCDQHAAHEVQGLCWERPEEQDLLDLLLAEGFQVHERKLYVERDLVGFQPAEPDPFDYLTLRDAGEPAFVEVLAGLEPGSPSPDGLAQARSGFQELLELAGSALDRDAWHVVRHRGDVVGLVLPQLFPDSPHEGTLYWIGLLPNWRGRGWGRILHARGLRHLSERGARRYIGSTPVENLPMRRVFAANGCTELGVRVLLRNRPPETCSG
ncbi:MAG: GNAT family N-acetyltransferase [Candidatus Delongbacteria bacterium]